MARWIEVAPGRKKLTDEAPSPEEAALHSERLNAMLSARAAPVASVWEPTRTVNVLGHEVGSRREWERIKKDRHLIEVSPRDSAVKEVHARPKFDPRAAAAQALETAMKMKQQDELPPLPPPRKDAAPPTPQRHVFTPEEDRHTPRDDRSDHEATVEVRSSVMRSGEVACEPEDAVADLFRRKGWGRM